MSDKVSDERLIEFVVRWAWRDSPITDTERLSAIKYHPAIKRLAAEQGYAAARINSAIEPAAAMLPTEAQVRQAFLDGISYATMVEVTDPELAWQQSRARAALLAARPISASGRGGE